MDHEGKATDAVAAGVSPPQGSVASAEATGDDASGGASIAADVAGAGGGPAAGRRPAAGEEFARSVSGSPKVSSLEAVGDGRFANGVAVAVPKRGVKARPRPATANHLKKFREELCLSQAELARRANLSALTVARIEQGYGCRMSTKRKILEALGLSLADRKRVFGEEE